MESGATSRNTVGMVFGAEGSEGTVTSRQLIQMVPITYRQLDHWCRRGYIPGHDGQPGSGSSRSFSKATVYHVACLASATKCGLALNHALAKRISELDLTSDQQIVMSDPNDSGTVTFRWSSEIMNMAWAARNGRPPSVPTQPPVVPSPAWGPTMGHR